RLYPAHIPFPSATLFRPRDDGVLAPLDRLDDGAGHRVLALAPRPAETRDGDVEERVDVGYRARRGARCVVVEGVGRGSRAGGGGHPSSLRSGAHPPADLWTARPRTARPRAGHAARGRDSGRQACAAAPTSSVASAWATRPRSRVPSGVCSSWSISPSVWTRCTRSPRL